MAHRPVQKTKSSLAALTLGAIGVVYGDIGTSVLYSVKEVFGSGHVPFTQENVYGVLSLLFWTLTVIVSLKYVVLDRKSTRLNSSHSQISYAVFCLKKKKKKQDANDRERIK